MKHNLKFFLWVMCLIAIQAKGQECSSYSLLPKRFCKPCVSLDHAQRLALLDAKKQQLRELLIEIDSLNQIIYRNEYREVIADFVEPVQDSTSQTELTRSRIDDAVTAYLRKSKDMRIETEPLRPGAELVYFSAVDAVNNAEKQRIDDVIISEELSESSDYGADGIADWEEKVAFDYFFGSRPTDEFPINDFFG